MVFYFCFSTLWWVTVINQISKVWFSHLSNDALLFVLCNLHNFFLGWIRLHGFVLWLFSQNHHSETHYCSFLLFISFFHSSLMVVAWSHFPVVITDARIVFNLVSSGHTWNVHYYKFWFNLQNLLMNFQGICPGIFWVSSLLHKFWFNLQNWLMIFHQPSSSISCFFFRINIAQCMCSSITTVNCWSLYRFCFKIFQFSCSSSNPNCFIFWSSRASSVINYKYRGNCD